MMPKITFSLLEPASPATTDSESSPEDSPQLAPQPTASAAAVAATSNIIQFASSLTSSFGGSVSSKRRLPGGPSSTTPSLTRDVKTRRREPARGDGKSMAHSGGWPKGRDHRDSQDLLDVHLAEQLRQAFGDPFLEDAILAAA